MSEWLLDRWHARMRKQKTTAELIAAQGPEPSSASLRLMQNSNTGMIFFNRVLSERELKRISRRLRRWVA